ncbi:MAG TPA: sigma-54 dependent transcriptional regulator [Gemmatimonadales bacterium]|nr:sigma-54 dependent transcriptional regulator [Gemmatimonadales bacterium]
MIPTLAALPARRISSLPPIDSAARSSIRILVVDDERTLRESCHSVLQAEGYNVALCGRGNEARDTLRRHPFDIALVDWFMGQVPGSELLRTALATNPGTIVIIITGNPSVASSLEALQAGAWDYLPKPFSGTQLQILIGRAAHAVLVARESSALNEQRAQQPGDGDKIAALGDAPLFRKAIALARRVAATDASVFLTGESGAGKELFARFIHDNSRRSSRLLVAVNCAALPEPLLESEMFGHCKGAFTGAVRDKPGLLETANGGTLFLDELIEMPKSIQAKLLRVIQDGVVRRVGSETTDAVVNVRFIAATNTNPEQAVQASQLREDLYYRLRVVPIHVPSLRERPEDIPLLAERFLAHYWSRHRDPGQPLPTLTKGALWALGAHPWPGNVRELQNVIEHAVVLLEPGADVRPEDIPFIDAGARDPEKLAEEELEGEDSSYYATRDRLLARFDRGYLTRVVMRAGGNLSKAARLARVDRTTFYRLMERHGLQRDLLTGGTE